MKTTVIESGYAMHPLYQPQLETSRSGNKVLIVSYRGNEYDQAINDAEQRFNVKDDASVTVIALPNGSEKIETDFTKLY